MPLPMNVGQLHWEVYIPAPTKGLKYWAKCPLDPNESLYWKFVVSFSCLLSQGGGRWLSFFVNTMTHRLA